MTKITSNIHSIENLDHPFPGLRIVPYLIEEAPNDLTLIDTCFISELPKLKSYIFNAGYDFKNIKRIILTHVHIDHIQAANEVKRLSGAKLYSHWTEARYLAHDPQYQGAPSHETVQNILNKFGVNMKDVIKKFGHFNVDPIIVDEQLKDGDMIGSIQVIHTPGHTPGHISLYSKKHKIMFGADSLFKSVLGMDDLFILPEVAIDPITAAISVRRISQIKFEKLLLAHQDSPILEGGQKAVEKVTYAALNSRSAIAALMT
jgi:glyoxylase-like metal-dependent hydrolase (beta-lactamase superfamily II)